MDKPQRIVLQERHAAGTLTRAGVSHSLLGAYDDIVLPPESQQVDYEGELVVVIGHGGRRIAEQDALDHVLGYTVANDITMRDFQYKTHQWIQGKAWDASTPVGPYLVRPSEVDISHAGIRTILNGQKVQESDLSRLIFSIPHLISTISTFSTLRTGDLILTGTPGGVGYARPSALPASRRSGHRRNRRRGRISQPRSRGRKPTMNQGPAAPAIDRSLTLQFKGDWGTANLHRVCGWICQELTDRSGPHTRIAIWNGRGFSDNVHAVGRSEVDVALATPAAFTAAALDRRGVYRDAHYPELRALGVVPQRDRLVVAVHAALGISTFAELREYKPPLSLATSINDGVNHVGLAAHAVLERSGVDVEGWGGTILEDERPFESLDHVLDGRANAIVHEAVMLPHWQRFGREYRFLEIEPDVLKSLEDSYGWPAATVPDDYFPDQPAFQTLDFSDFVVLTRSDLADDVAYAIAWILGETREILESQYRHLPPHRSPVTYPLDPPTMGITPIPLHPGAARYYHAVSEDKTDSRSR